MSITGSAPEADWAVRLVGHATGAIIRHEVGLPGAPDSASGWHRVELHGDGSVVLDALDRAGSRQFSARVATAVVQRVQEILAEEGFPAIATGPIYPGPSWRAVTVALAGAEARVVLARTIAERREPLRELCEWFDSITAAIKGQVPPGLLARRAVSVTDVRLRAPGGR